MIVGSILIYISEFQRPFQLFKNSKVKAYTMRYIRKLRSCIHWVFLMRIVFMKVVSLQKSKNEIDTAIMLRLSFKNSDKKVFRKLPEVFFWGYAIAYLITKSTMFHQQVFLCECRRSNSAHKSKQLNKWCVVLWLRKWVPSFLNSRITKPRLE